MPSDSGRRRKEDRSFWIRSAFFLEKYKLLWFVGVSVLTLFGWQYVSPTERFELLSQQQKATAAQVGREHEDIQDIKKTLKLLVTMQCLDRTKKELALMQIDCHEVEMYRDSLGR